MKRSEDWRPRRSSSSLRVGGFGRPPDHSGGDGQPKPPPGCIEPAFPEEPFQERARLIIEGLGLIRVPRVTRLGAARAHVFLDRRIPGVSETLLAPPTEEPAGLELLDQVKRPESPVGAESTQDVALLWEPGAPGPTDDGERCVRRQSSRDP